MAVWAAGLAERVPRLRTGSNAPPAPAAASSRGGCRSTPAGSTGERTIWPFDGIGFLPQITVYASPDLFRKIGLAANQFAPQRVRQPLAALASRPRDRFGTNLIALSGKPLAQPERLAVVGDPGPIPA
ncbi:MAG: hypothetical protein NZM27_03690 [Acetobacteraceae bacterium]|nr:hypothetical protein [Acetobacteraceae bacterium]